MTQTWLATFSEDERKLLLACALLGEFDAQVLTALVGNADQVQSFLNTSTRFGLLQRSPQSNLGQYALEPTVNEQILPQLRNEFTSLYRMYRERAFTYFMQQIASAPAAARQATERAMMAHLEALFLILIGDNELVRLVEILDTVAQLNLPELHHRHQLRFFRAALLRQQGTYGAAENEFSALLDEPGLARTLRARVLNGMGILYDYRGQFDKALAAYAQSAEQYQTLSDLIGASKAWKNQGIVYHQLGQYDKARPLFEQCLAVAQATADRVLEARVLGELGYTAKELGEWDKALAYYEKARQLAQASDYGELTARMNNNLGSLHCLLGHWTEAETHYRNALALIRDRRDVADIKHNLGFLCFVQQRDAEAIQWYEEGLAIAQAIFDGDAISEFYYRLGFLQECRGELTSAYQAYSQAIEIIEKLRGQASQEETRISVFGLRQHLYQSMVLLCLQLGKVAEALSYVERAKSRAFLDLLSQTVIPDTLPTEQPLSAAEIQAQLPPETVLVEYFATGQIGLGETMLKNLPSATQHLRAYLAPPERLLAFVVSRDTLVSVPLAGTLSQIEAQYFYRGDQRLRGTRPLAGQPLPPLHLWRNLDQQLLTPLRPYLQNKRHIFLSPHNTLHYIPLHTLGEQTDATTAPTISYTPSASVLLKASLRNQSLDKKALHSLTIGVNRAGLYYAETEAQWIAQSIGGKALCGEAATPELVCEQLPTANVIHFACHGLFRRTTPLQSGLLLTNGELTAAQILQQVRLNAALVILSACDTGLNHLAQGDELIGLTRAFLAVGTHALVVTLWQVIDLPARLFMEKFYECWRGEASKAVALQVAQQYLRTIDSATVQARLNEFGLSPEQIEQQMAVLRRMLPGTYPFDHPYYWGAFLLIGDPR